MARLKIHLPNILISALGFGLGSVIVTYVERLIFNSRLLIPIRDLFEAGRLPLGITLILLVVGLGGAIGGAIGGLALSTINKSSKSGYAWRGAVSLGVSYAIVLAPVTITIALISFYQIAESSPIMLMVPLGLMGVIFGIVSGLIFGLLTAGRDTWRVVLMSMVGFALGGGGFGYCLWGYFFGTAGFREGLWLLFVGFFIFGAFGGAADVFRIFGEGFEPDGNDQCI